MNSANLVEIILEGSNLIGKTKKEILDTVFE
jgi:hypothetical protein